MVGVGSRGTSMYYMGGVSVWGELVYMGEQVCMGELVGGGWCVCGS